MSNIKEISNINDLNTVGWTEEDTIEFLYSLHRIMLFVLTEEWKDALIGNNLENKFVQEVLLFFINRYWIYRHTIELTTLQDSIGYVLTKNFAD